MLVFPVLAGRENIRRERYLFRLLENKEIKTIQLVDLFKYPKSISEADLRFILEIIEKLSEDYTITVSHFMPFPSTNYKEYQNPGVYMPEWSELPAEFSILRAFSDNIEQPAPEIGTEIILEYDNCSFNFLQQILVRFKVMRVVIREEEKKEEESPFDKIIWGCVFSYGKENIIETSALPKISFITGPNMSGKSSLYKIFSADNLPGMREYEGMRRDSKTAYLDTRKLLKMVPLQFVPENNAHLINIGGFFLDSDLMIRYKNSFRAKISTGSIGQRLIINLVYFQFDYDFVFLDEIFSNIDLEKTEKLIDFLQNVRGKIIILDHKAELRSLLPYFEIKDHFGRSQLKIEK